MLTCLIHPTRGFDVPNPQTSVTKDIGDWPFGQISPSILLPPRTVRCLCRHVARMNSEVRMWNNDCGASYTGFLISVTMFRHHVIGIDWCIYLDHEVILKVRLFGSLYLADWSHYLYLDVFKWDIFHALILWVQVKWVSGKTRSRPSNKIQMIKIGSGIEELERVLHMTEFRSG